MKSLYRTESRAEVDLLILLPGCCGPGSKLKESSLQSVVFLNIFQVFSFDPGA